MKQVCPSLFVLILITNVVRALYWTHYLYMFWPDEREANDTKFNETLIDEWREGFVKSARNHEIYYNNHNVYSDMIEIEKEPHLYDYVRREEPANLFHSSLRHLDAWIRRGIYFEPQGRSKRNDTLILQILIRNFQYIRSSVANQASFSLYDSVEMLPRNRWYNALEKDLRGLKTLFHEHVIVHTKPNVTFTHQQITVRLHDTIMRIFAINTYNDWFRDTMPSYLPDMITMRQGYIPHSLFSPRMLERLFCELQKNMQPHFEMWKNCADYYYYYSVRMVSVARTHNHLLLRFEIPIIQIMPAPKVKNDSNDDVVMGTVNFVPSTGKEKAWYTILRYLATVLYATYSIFLYLLAVALLVNLIRDPAWVNILRGYALIYPQYRVEAMPVNDIVDTVTTASNKAFIDLVFRILLLLTVVSILVFGWMRRVRLSSHGGYEVHAVPHRGRISQYRVYIKFLLPTNTLKASHFQEVTIMTRLINRRIHNDTDHLQLIGSLFTWTIEAKHGNKCFTLLSPLYIECIDAGGLIITHIQYWLDIPLEDIRWDAYKCPKGLTSPLAHGQAQVQIVREVEAIYQNIGDFCSPKHGRQREAIEIGPEEMETRL